MSDPRLFTLDLAAPLRVQVTRLGYPDEGIRLTIAHGMPFEFSTELKLSRRDTERLIAALQHQLADPSSENLR
jgi:hypothetical protein